MFQVTLGVGGQAWKLSVFRHLRDFKMSGMVYRGSLLINKCQSVELRIDINSVSLY